LLCHYTTIYYNSSGWFKYFQKTKVQTSTITPDKISSKAAQLRSMIFKA
jgi:hypothetical protein